MPLPCLLHVGFVLDPEVTWPIIYEALNKLEEDERAGADELDLLERQQIVHDNIRRLVIKLDEDAEEFLANDLKDIEERINLEYSRFSPKKFLHVFGATAMMTPCLMFKTGIISLSAALIAEAFVIGCYSFTVRYIKRKEIEDIAKMIHLNPYPDWLAYHSVSREMFSFLAYPITSSSHPHFFNLLHSLNDPDDFPIDD